MKVRPQACPLCFACEGRGPRPSGPGLCSVRLPPPLPPSRARCRRLGPLLCAPRPAPHGPPFPHPLPPGPQDEASTGHAKVQELRGLSTWSEGQVWVCPEQHGTITAVFKNQIDWIPLALGSVRPTQGRTLCIAQASGWVGGWVGGWVARGEGVGWWANARGEGRGGRTGRQGAGRGRCAAASHARVHPSSRVLTPRHGAARLGRACNSPPTPLRPCPPASTGAPPHYGRPPARAARRSTAAASPSTWSTRCACWAGG
jgi:hypothetical protein